MYLIGAPHPLKHSAQSAVKSALSNRERLVTSAEVLQEICHRYTAIDRPEAIQPAFDALLGLVDEVLPIELTEVALAKDLILQYPNASARDALHVASMRTAKLTRIITFDKGFDDFAGVERIGD
jgi:predicted nucleic acid-binding protein